MFTDTPKLPATQDRSAWRAYFVAQQSAAMTAAPAISPTEAYSQTLPQVTALYLAAFPGCGAEAASIFSPGAAPAQA